VIRAMNDRCRPFRDLAGFLAIVALAQLVHPQPSVLISTDAGGAPADLIEAGDHLYFTADDGISGRELWRLDAHGEVQQVRDFISGPYGSDPRHFVSSGERLYFTSLESKNTNSFEVPLESRSLFVIDGDDIYKLASGIREHAPIKIAPFASGVAVLMNQPESGYELWYAGPNHAPLTLLHEFVPGPHDGATPSLLLPHHDGILVSGFFPQGGTLSIVWYFAAPGIAPVPVRDEQSSDALEEAGILNFTQNEAGDTYIAVYVSGTDFWRIAGPEVRATRIYGNHGDGVLVSQIFAKDEALYMARRDSGSGVELFVQTPDHAAPQLLRDINPGPPDSNPFRFAAFGNHVLFIADSQQFGPEIWRTSGTPESTQLLRDLMPGPLSAEAYSFCPYGNGMFFSCDNEDWGEELWFTDGTAEGTRLVKDISPGLSQSEPFYLTPFNGAVYFTAITPAAGPEIWKSDGTTEGTVQVTQIHPPGRIIRSSSPSFLTVLSDLVYFAATSPGTGRELWQSDGTRNGTYCVADIAPGRDSSNPRTLQAHEGRLYFQAGSTSDTINYVWDPVAKSLSKVDLPGDSPVDAISPLPAGLRRGSLEFYAHWTDSTGEEPWVRDRVTNSEQLLFDVMPGRASSSPREWTAVGDLVYFRAQDPIRGTEIWQSDGTPAGTRLTADYLPTPISSVPQQLAAFRDGLIMLIRLQDGGQQILDIQPDGIGGGSWLSVWQQNNLHVSELVSTSKGFYFTATHPAWGTELWRSCPNSIEVQLVRDIYPNSLSTNSNNAHEPQKHLEELVDPDL